MALFDLIRGMALIIDDEIHTEDANIRTILEELNRLHIPYSAIDELPADEMIRHFTSLSFVLLDWMLKKDTPVGVTGSEFIYQQNIEFLKKLNEVYFGPIFIFTNEDPARIYQILERNRLISERMSNQYLIIRKDEIIGRMEEVIEKWLSESPTIYVLSEYLHCFMESLNSTLRMFYSINQSWAKIFWEAFDADSVNPNHELTDIITRNVINRMNIPSYDSGIIRSENQDYNLDELRKLISAANYIEARSLDNTQIQSGDVFRLDDGLWVNIRPDCDCIQRSSKPIDLYLLQMKPISPEKEHEKYDKDYGFLKEKGYECIAFSVIDGRSYSINLNKFTLKQLTVENRIGRIIPPIITRIQQKFASYIQRQGLPRIPIQAIHQKRLPEGDTRESKETAG